MSKTDSINTTYYIGVMSGTSIDGIDVALVEQQGTRTVFIAGEEFAFTEDLRDDVLTLCQEQHIGLKALGELTHRLSTAYADAINAFLASHNIKVAEITAIGCHGQTVFHQPNGETPFSMQLINPNVITAKTDITTVFDFRSMDIALGGQGAPLVPLFHQSLIDPQSNYPQKDDQALVFLNLGGIANISIVNPAPLVGFDTGPANVLLDAWVQRVNGNSYDKNGELAAKGVCNHGLLNLLLTEPYFALSGPKSSGRELFNLTWLEQRLSQCSDVINDADIMATLVQLTCQTVIDQVKHLSAGRLLVCGGGAKNQSIMNCLASGLPQWQVCTTDSVGISGDFIEAMAFAWLAYRCLNRLSGNDPTVTGASRAEICGSICRISRSY